MTEWKTGEESENHAKAFAEELKNLMAKYEATFSSNVETYGYGGCSANPCFDFDCCSNTVELDNYTDGTDLEVR